MTSIYRHVPEVERATGTINLRTWLRKVMRPAAVNRALLMISREPYSIHYFPTNVYGLDVSVEITPASGQFAMQRLYW